MSKLHWLLAGAILTSIVFAVAEAIRDRGRKDRIDQRGRYRRDKLEPRDIPETLRDQHQAAVPRDLRRDP